MSTIDRKILAAAICIVVAIIICGVLTTISKRPEVRIRWGLWGNTIYLPVKNGFEFSEDVYSVVNTQIGYDIVIHCVPKDINIGGMQ